MPGVLVVKQAASPGFRLARPGQVPPSALAGSGPGEEGEEEDVLRHCLRQARLPRGTNPPLPDRAPALISHGPERLSLAICSPGHRPNHGDKLLMEPQLERARGAAAEGAEGGWR